MDRITANDNLNKVVSCLPDRRFDFMVRMASGPLGRLVGAVTFTQLAKSAKVWSADTMASGMNFLVEMTREGQVFFPLYSEEERLADKGKRQTGLACFLQKNRAKLAVVIPGGGYASVATMQEGYPVAKALYEMGYHVVVLQYRCGKQAKAPNPMDDLAQAIHLLRQNAEAWQIDMENYAVIGFSAGGHLAASFGTESMGYARHGLPKPGIMILGYPVITMGVHTHMGSRKNLLGSRTDLRDLYSVEKRITWNYPKTFVWQCDRDNTVPIQNTQMLVSALESQGVPCQYEIFDSDAHGWGLADETPAQGWLDRAVRFWNVAE